MCVGNSYYDILAFRTSVRLCVVTDSSLIIVSLIMLHLFIWYCHSRQHLQHYCSDIGSNVSFLLSVAAVVNVFERRCSCCC